MAKSNRTILGSVLAAMAIPLLITIVSAAARGSNDLVPEPAARGSRCLQDPITMRYHHMTHLRSLRDRVVRDGDRAGVHPRSQLGVSDCGNCHRDQLAFCERCHGAAGVRIDCFSCHNWGTRPQPGPSSLQARGELSWR